MRLIAGYAMGDKKQGPLHRSGPCYAYRFVFCLGG